LSAPAANGAHDYAGRDLEAMAFARNYHGWIRDLFAPHVRGDVAEVGAGDARFSTLLLELAPRSLTLFEPSADMHARQRTYLPEAAPVTRHQATFTDLADRHVAVFDTMVYVNVMEHIADDDGELALIHRALRPGGTLCLFVPALPWLMSDFDRSIGHHRRYVRAALRTQARSAGFELVRSHYLDFPGVLPWFVIMRLMRGQLTLAKVATYDRYVVPWMRRIETLRPPPFGKNLILIARKRD